MCSPRRSRRPALMQWLGCVVASLLSGCERTADTAATGLMRTHSHAVLALRTESSLVYLRVESDSKDRFAKIDCRTTGVYELSDGRARRVLTGRAACDIIGPGVPAASADGRYLAYYRDGAIHVIDLSTGSTRRLSDSSVLFPQGPAWSPDGYRVAFVARPSPDNGKPSDFGVFVVNSDGSQLRLLVPLGPGTPASAITWSPDQGALALSLRTPNTGGSSLTRRVVVVDTLGGPQRVVATGTDPSWQPTGEWIAYLTPRYSQQGDSSEFAVLRLVRPDGTGDRALYPRTNKAGYGGNSNGDLVGPLAWSTDGTTIAFSRQGVHGSTIWTIRVDGMGLQAVTGDSTDVRTRQHR
jgi:Tol biopolymer transport system component